MKFQSLVIASLGLCLGLCQVGWATDPVVKTAKQASAEFGLTDADLTLVPPELYDCIRHYASTGAKYMKEPADDAHVADFTKKLASMRRASTKRFAASYVCSKDLRFVLLRDASGMYQMFKYAALSTSVNAATTMDVSVNGSVLSLYPHQTDLRGEFDRAFLSRGEDGKTYLHEEICVLDEEGAEPKLYGERFLMEELEGTWEGYLRGDVVVVRLGQAEADKRQRAQARQFKSKEGGDKDGSDGAAVEALREAAKIRPDEKTEVETSNQELRWGPALLYIKRDAMLWIDSARSTRFTTVSAQK